MVRARSRSKPTGRAGLRLDHFESGLISDGGSSMGDSDGGLLLECIPFPELPLLFPYQAGLKDEVRHPVREERATRSRRGFSRRSVPTPAKQRKKSLMKKLLLTPFRLRSKYSKDHKPGKIPLLLRFRCGPPLEEIYAHEDNPTESFSSDTPEEESSSSAFSFWSDVDEMKADSFASSQGDLSCEMEKDRTEYAAAVMIQSQWRQHRSYSSIRMQDTPSSHLPLSSTQSFQNDEKLSSPPPPPPPHTASSMEHGHNRPRSLDSSEIPFFEINGEAMTALAMLENPSQLSPGEAKKLPRRSIDARITTPKVLKDKERLPHNHISSVLETIVKPKLSRSATEPTKKTPPRYDKHDATALTMTKPATPSRFLCRSKLARCASDPISKPGTPLKPPLCPRGLSLDVGYLSLMRPKTPPIPAGRADEQLNASLVLAPNKHLATITRGRSDSFVAQNYNSMPPSLLTDHHVSKPSSFVQHRPPYAMSRSRSSPVAAKAIAWTPGEKSSSSFKTTIERPVLARVVSENDTENLMQMKDPPKQIRSRRRHSRRYSMDDARIACLELQLGLLRPHNHASGLPLHPKSVSSMLLLPEPQRTGCIESMDYSFQQRSSNCSNQLFAALEKVGNQSRRHLEEMAARQIESQWRCREEQTTTIDNINQSGDLPIIMDAEDAIEVLY